ESTVNSMGAATQGQGVDTAFPRPPRQMDHVCGLPQARELAGEGDWRKTLGRARRITRCLFPALEPCEVTTGNGRGAVTMIARARARRAPAQRRLLGDVAGAEQSACPCCRPHRGCVGELRAPHLARTWPALDPHLG